jgi:putative ABC transport system permease protein
MQQQSDQQFLRTGLAGTVLAKEPDGAEARSAPYACMIGPREEFAMSGWSTTTFVHSMHYALRSLARAPGFALTVVLTLGVGIGASTAVFSVVDTVVIRPLPFLQADRLVALSHTDATTGVRVDIPPVRLRDWSERSSAFETIAAYYTEDMPDTTGNRPENVRRARVTPGFFSLWRIGPALGRVFGADEHRFGGPAAALLSDRYWRERRASDPGVLGQTLQLDGQPWTIVGVLPAAFASVDDSVDVWTPLPVDAPWAGDRTNGWFGSVVGRLAPGVTIEQGRADIETIQGRLAAELPQTDRNLAISAVPYKETIVGDVGASLWLLFAAVSALLLVACANIAALLLARAAQRERDVAIRYTLGASRGAIAAQVLAETVALVALGAVVGSLAARAVVAGLTRFAAELPRLQEVAIDGRILVYTIASAIATALLCGLVPAARAARGAGSAVGSDRWQVSARHSLNWLLVGVQVALSVALLAGAGLLLRSFDALSRVDPGFNAEQVLVFRQSGSYAETSDFAGMVQRISRTLDELAALPGVEAAATSLTVPGVSAGFQQEVAILEGGGVPEARLVAEIRTVAPSYFETLQIPLLSGTLCRQSDFEAREVMINRSFAERYFPNRSAIGLHFAGSSPDRIVGVVGDARELGTNMAPVPTIYDCFNAPNPFPRFLVRTSGDPASLVERVRARLNELEPSRAVYDVAPLDERIGDIYAENRLRTVLLTLFSAAALALACLGIYGTMSYVVSLRRREVGVRVALGALERSIVEHFLWRALKVVGVGCAAGLALALAFSRLLEGMLYGVPTTDPLTLATVVVFVVAAAGLAAALPASRAARIDPLRALRED